MKLVGSGIDDVIERGPLAIIGVEHQVDAIAVSKPPCMARHPVTLMAMDYQVEGYALTISKATF